MPRFKKLKFNISGNLDGIDFTPTTIPMSILAEYLSDLAELLGHKESVHLISVEEGSAAPLVLYDEAEESRIFHRVYGAAAGNGEPNAVKAYRSIDARCKKYEGSGSIDDIDRRKNVIEFPGAKKDSALTYGPIKESVTAIGMVRRVGGKGDTIPIWLERADGETIYCETTEALSLEISDYYLQIIRVYGTAVWFRKADGEWRQNKFVIRSYDHDPVPNESIAATFEKLRAVPGSEWPDVKDPLSELRKMRDGEDETEQ